MSPSGPSPSGLLWSGGGRSGPALVRSACTDRDRFVQSCRYGPLCTNGDRFVQGCWAVQIGGYLYGAGGRSVGRVLAGRL
jgi:hypothetical protein